MIHSLSGGVIADGELYLFAKVRIGGVPRWYLSPFPMLAAGDRVRVPFGGGLAEGTVERVERCTVQMAPCSVRHAEEIAEIL